MAGAVIFANIIIAGGAAFIGLPAIAAGLIIAGLVVVAVALLVYFIPGRAEEGRRQEHARVMSRAISLSTWTSEACAEMNNLAKAAEQAAMDEYG